MKSLMFVLAFLIGTCSIFVQATARADFSLWPFKNRTAVLQTPSGPMQGKDLGDVEAYLGIPYAKPPIGQLRWKAPLAKPTWSQTLDATEFGPECLQEKFVSLTGSLAGQEDCLYLNVWTPQNQNSSVKANKPVMVFIHGGEFLLGSGDQKLFFGSLFGSVYDGENLARRQSAVVVTMNFRIGMLGFMAHPEAAAKDPNGAVGNYGVMDTIQALKWVQANIEKFGGDKNRVMIFGESSGAVMTGALVASPLAKGLFHSAALQSGFYEASKANDLYATTLKVQKELSCRSLNCLRKLPAEQIVKMQYAYGRELKYAFDPRTYQNAAGLSLVVDGYLLPKSPVDMVREGLHNRVPLIIGSNRDEGELFVQPQDILTCGAYIDRITKGTGLANEVLQEFPCGLIARKSLVKYISTIGFQCPTRRLVRAAAKYGPVYNYVFSYRSPGPVGVFGAPHFAEVPYVFGNLATAANLFLPSALWMSSVIQDYWGSLAATGNPNQPGQALWPMYNEHDDAAMNFNTPLSLITDFEKDHCDFADRNVYGSSQF